MLRQKFELRFFKSRNPIKEVLHARMSMQVTYIENFSKDVLLQ